MANTQSFVESVVLHGMWVSKSASISNWKRGRSPRDLKILKYLYFSDGILKKGQNDF